MARIGEKSHGTCLCCQTGMSIPMSKTESEVPPLARNATVPVSVAKQECPSRCRKLNLRHLHWRETPWYLSLLPNRIVRKACE